MKVKVLIASEPGLDGVKNHVVNILKFVRLDLFNVTYVYSKFRKDKIYDSEIKLLEKRGIECIEVPMKPSVGLNDIASFFKIYRIISKGKFDVVHAHSSKAGILARFVAKFCSVPMIIYTPNAFAFQANNSRVKKNIYLIFEYMASLVTDILICVSESEKQEAIKKKLIHEDKIKLIYNGVDTEKYELLKKPKIDIIRKKLAIEKGTIIIGSVGRMTYQKNTELLFKSYEKLTHKLPANFMKSVKFYHIGTGELDYLINDYETKLKGHLVHQSYSDGIENYLALFDVFVLSSRYEGLPIAMLEAMSCGCAIVGTDVTGIKDIVEDDVNGYLATEDDEDISNKIMDIIVNKKNTSFGSAARKEIKEVYSIQKMINSLEKIYKR